MHRRAVALGTLLACTAGCTDRVHDLVASTPADIDVRSRYVDGDPLVESASIVQRSAEAETHLLSFRSWAAAAGAIGSDAAAHPDDADASGSDTLPSDAAAHESFVAATEFVDDGGRSILLVVQRITSPAVDLRLRGVSRTGGRSLRVAADEVGTPNDADPAVKTLFVRLADGHATPERVTASVEGDRVSVTI